MIMRIENNFDRLKHIYHSDTFSEIIKDTIRFFNGTPVVNIPPPEKFIGQGVYALYYIGSSEYYSYLYDINRVNFVMPIYVGKAVPSGWRQSRITNSEGHELYSRLKDHYNSLSEAENLLADDFKCRFMILEGAAVDMISTIEAALIRQYVPIWNSCIDGFGNHDPGKGRYNQAKSEWDILHPGRKWANKCVGESASLKIVEKKLMEYQNGK